MNDLVNNTTKPENIEELFHRILQIIVPIYSKVTPDEVKFRKNIEQAKASDAQLISLQILIESQKKTQNGGYKYFKANHPNLMDYPDRSRFNRTLRNLHSVIQAMRFELRLTRAYDYAIIDFFPLVCNKFGRAYFGKRLRDICSYGYCASKKEKYYGLKCHVVTDINGNPIDYIVTSANVDDKEAVFELTEKCNMLNLFGDKGYAKKGFYEEVKEETGTRLFALKKKNDKDPLPKDFRNLISHYRRRIETTFGQFIELFDIERIRANTKIGLSTFLNCKFLCFNVLAIIAGHTQVSQIVNFN